MPSYRTGQRLLITDSAMIVEWDKLTCAYVGPSLNGGLHFVTLIPKTIGVESPFLVAP